MNKSTNHPTARSASPWLRTAPHTARALDVSHWQSRAARGHSWNAAAATRPHLSTPHHSTMRTQA
jgi:hypothetical protein